MFHLNDVHGVSVQHLKKKTECQATHLSSKVLGGRLSSRLWWGGVPLALATKGYQSFMLLIGGHMLKGLFGKFPTKNVDPLILGRFAFYSSSLKNLESLKKVWGDKGR